MANTGPASFLWLYRTFVILLICTMQNVKAIDSRMNQRITSLFALNCEDPLAQVAR